MNDSDPIKRRTPEGEPPSEAGLAPPPCSPPGVPVGLSRPRYFRPYVKHLVDAFEALNGRKPSEIHLTEGLVEEWRDGHPDMSSWESMFGVRIASRDSDVVFVR